MTGAHVILAGDSIFDNAIYVPGEPCVVEQLRAVLGDDSEVSMVAVDGSFAEEVPAQIRSLPESATHVCVSAGGNDALRCLPKLYLRDPSMANPFKEWADIQDLFRRHYRMMLQAVQATGLKSAVCTVYDAVPTVGAIERTALSLFNDVIVAEAVSRHVPVIDLRRVCTDESDYSSLSPIEPSRTGGDKIANVLARVLREHDFARPQATLYW